MELIRIAGLSLTNEQFSSVLDVVVYLLCFSYSHLFFYVITNDNKCSIIFYIIYFTYIYVFIIYIVNSYYLFVIKYRIIFIRTGCNSISALFSIQSPLFLCYHK